MTHSRKQFFTIWVIFGFVIYYSILQFIGMLKEIIFTLGIILDLNPNLLKHSGAFTYGIVLILVLFYSYKIVGEKATQIDQFEISSLRKPFIIIFLAGILSQISSHFIKVYRTGIFSEYLDRHKYMYDNFYPASYYSAGIVSFLILIALIYTFFILTKSKKY
jgi:hypothetical protein